MYMYLVFKIKFEVGGVELVHSHVAILTSTAIAVGERERERERERDRRCEADCSPGCTYLDLGGRVWFGWTATSNHYHSVTDT